MARTWHKDWHKKPFDKMTALQRQHYNREASLAFAPNEEARQRVLARHAANPIEPMPEVRERTDKRPAREGPSEHQLQAAVISWWGHVCASYGLPPFTLAAIPNGGARDAITGARLKAEGVRPGMPDLCLMAARGAYHGLYLEMKTGDNQPSEKQTQILNYLDGAGYKTAVHWDSNKAIDAIKEYLAT